MVDNPRRLAEIMLKSEIRLNVSRNLEGRTADLLKRAGNAIRDSHERLARNRHDLERFRTLGCSTESQRAYRRSRAAVSAKRALEGALSASSLKIKTVEDGGEIAG